MLKALRKFYRIFCPFVLFLLQTGCFFQPVEELYHLPTQSVEYNQLISEITSLRSALELQNPGVEYANILSGDNTATIQLQNLTDEGEVDTAITFLRVASAEEPIKIYILSLNSEGNYVPHCLIQGQGNSILSVEFAELNGTGKKEILVNWQNNHLGVYSLDFTPTPNIDPALPFLEQIPPATELLSTTHSTYALTDMNGNGLNDLSVVRLDTAGFNSYVELYHWNDGALVTHSIAPLSDSITTLSNVRVNYITGKTPALYISSNLVDNSRTTDILTLENDRLSNLTLDTDTGISTETLRDYRDIGPTDINNDGILEIPDPLALPTYVEDDGSGNVVLPATSFWLIDWNQFNIRGSYNMVGTTYHNIADSWYLEIPSHWREQITISRDDSISGQRTVIFSRWNEAGSAPTPFLAIYKLTGPNRYTRAELSSRFELGGDTTTIYAATFYEDSWDCGLEEQDVIKRFHLIISAWS